MGGSTALFFDISMVLKATIFILVQGDLDYWSISLWRAKKSVIMV